MSDLWFLDFSAQMHFDADSRDEQQQLQRLLKNYPELQQTQLKMMFSAKDDRPQQLQSSWFCQRGDNLSLSCFKVELLQLVQQFMQQRQHEQDPWFEGMVRINAGEIEIDWLA